MNLRRQLAINWWFWAAISVPWILVVLFRRYEVKGAVSSDWSDAMYRIRVGEWRYLRETMFWDLFLPLVLGWVAHYFISMAWQQLRGSRTTTG